MAGTGRASAFGGGLLEGFLGCPPTDTVRIGCTRTPGSLCWGGRVPCVAVALPTAPMEFWSARGGDDDVVDARKVAGSTMPIWVWLGEKLGTAGALGIWNECCCWGRGLGEGSVLGWAGFCRGGSGVRGGGGPGGGGE